MERFGIHELATALVEKHGMTEQDAEAFARDFFGIIAEALEHERYVKVKGLGTFKLITVESRGSVSVNTGRRIEIQEHSKISFTPDAQLRDTINKPFAHFETVVLNPGVEFPDLATEPSAEATETLEAPVQPTETPAQPAETPAEEAPATTTEAPEPASQPEATSVTSPQPEEQPATPAPPRKPKRIVAPLILVAIVAVAALAGWYFARPIDPKPAVARTTTSQPKAQPRALAPDTATQPVPQPATQPEKPAQQPSAPAAKPATTTPAATTHFVPDSTSYNILGTMGTHTVGEGETLTRIALRYYGTKALWPYLVKHNAARIKNPNHVPAGTTLDIPRLEKKQ